MAHLEFGGSRYSQDTCNERNMCQDGRVEYMTFDWIGSIPQLGSFLCIQNDINAESGINVINVDPAFVCDWYDNDAGHRVMVMS
jgi:hypothetical protein